MANKSKQETSNPLDNFSWDNDSDFFDIKGEEDTAVVDIKGVAGEDDDFEEEVPNDPPSSSKNKTTEEKSDKKPKTSDNEDDDEEEDEEAFFEQEPKGKKTKSAKVPEESDDEDEEVNEKSSKKIKVKKGRDTEEEDDKEEEEEDDDKKFFTQLGKEMQERGTFQHVELKDDEELDEETFFESMDQEVEGRVNETFEAFFEELDDDGAAFLKFKRDGGKTVDFFRTYGQSQLPFEEFDVDNKTHQEQVVRQYHTTVDKLDPDEIEEKLEWLREKGSMQSQSEKYYAKLKKVQEAEQAKLLQSQREQKEKKENNIKAFNKAITDLLDTTEAVSKFKFTKEDKKSLPAFITKATEKVGKDKYATPLNKKLGEILTAATPENKARFLLLAKLVRDDFDVTDLETSTRTKVVREARSKLAEAKKNFKPSSSGNNTKKSLTDFF